MKNLQFNPNQCRIRRGWGGVGQVGSKKSKPIPAPPRGVGLKSCPTPWCKTKISPHPYPTTFSRPGKLAWSEVGRGGSSRAGRSKIAIPNKQSWETDFRQLLSLYLFL